MGEAVLGQVGGEVAVMMPGPLVTVTIIALLSGMVCIRVGFLHEPVNVMVTLTVFPTVVVGFGGVNSGVKNTCRGSLLRKTCRPESEVMVGGVLLREKGVGECVWVSACVKRWSGRENEEKEEEEEEGDTHTTCEAGAHQQL